MNVGNLVFQWYRLPKRPKIVKVLSYNTILKKLFYLYPNAQTILSDKDYYLHKTDELVDIFKLNRFNEFPYLAERRDCDDFSWAFVGLMKKLLPGFIIGKCHANFYKDDGSLDFKHDFAFFIDENENLMFVEPQTNKIFSPKKNIVPYLFFS